jgi:hypothetical protein
MALGPPKWMKAVIHGGIDALVIGDRGHVISE